MHRFVYYKGALLRENEIFISPFNRGLHYGDGVFETLRAYSGKFFRFEEHFNRLNEGLKRLKIDASFDSNEIYRAAENVLQANHLSDARLKIIAFREGADGPNPSPGLKASILITAGPFNDKTKLSHEKGIRGHIVSIRRNNYSPISFIKSLNYLDNILGRLEASENKTEEAIFLNIPGRVAEGSTSNIFIIKQGTVFTPPVTEGILNGITRDVIFQISSEIGIKCLEKEFPPGQLFEADESFLTNSLMEIMPLVSVNGKPVGTGNPGEITKALMDRYSYIVKKETGVSI